MVSFSSLVNSIPFSSSTWSTLAYSTAAVAATSFSYGGVNLQTLVAGGAALAGFAAKYVRKNEETRQEKKKIMDGHFQQFMTLLSQIVESPDNKYSPIAQQNLRNLFHTLNQYKVSQEQGNDDLRTKYVPAQAACEHAIFITCYLNNLASPQNKPLVVFNGGIHTPTPATPLCADPKGQVPLTLFASQSPSAEVFKTVADRTVTARRLGQLGTLYVIYPKGGLEKRTAEEQAIYKRTLSEYPGLKDTALNCQEMAEGMIGATYVLKFSDGSDLIFAISAPQANAPKDSAKWGMWLGTGEDQAVVQRLKALNAFLQPNQGPLLN